MNFTYITVKPNDGSFGNVQDDGSWTGIVGDLQNEKVDIGKPNSLFDNSELFIIFFYTAVSPLAENLERSEVISFSIPIYQARTELFLKNPNDALKFSTYVEPLTWIAWIFIGLFVITMSFFLYATTRYSNILYHIQSK